MRESVLDKTQDWSVSPGGILHRLYFSVTNFLSDLEQIAPSSQGAFSLPMRKQMCSESTGLNQG